MLPLVFIALITLPSLDPDAVPSAPPHIGQSASTDGLASGTADAASLGEGLNVQACTFGSPLAGTNLFADASQLERTATMPQCASSPFGYGPGGYTNAFGAFGDPFAAYPYGLAGLGAFLPFGAPPFDLGLAPQNAPDTHRLGAPGLRRTASFPKELPPMGGLERRGSFERTTAVQGNRVPTRR